jgi:outer membrane protein W
MKNLLSALILTLLLAPYAIAGNIDFSANAGLYTAPGGIGSSTMYGVSATQPLTDHLSVRAMLQTTTYTVAGQSTTYTPISIDAIYSQPLPGGITPYAGAGLSYNSVSSGGSSSQSTGAQAEVGLNYRFGAVTAGLEYRFMLPDLNNTSLNSSTFNGSVSGAVSQSISF